jgi:hypothetical protein
VQVAGAEAGLSGDEARLSAGASNAPAAHSVASAADNIAPRPHCIASAPESIRNDPITASRASRDGLLTVEWVRPWTGAAMVGGMVARLRPQLLAQHPSIGCGWHEVLERNPGALTPEPGEDRVWVLVAGRPRLLPRTILEFWDGRPE